MRAKNNVRIGWLHVEKGGETEMELFCSDVLLLNVRIELSILTLRLHYKVPIYIFAVSRTVLFILGFGMGLRLGVEKTVKEKLRKLIRYL